ncbi:ROK family glucokinase [Bacillus alkalicellulosilyticus]|uniref:ROK family glucokinase n=1 Tax=Alkalihalobacterium alkalicellulosilyticum TaxID=1912214 RepID=UPI0009984D6B|nr:ROK family glucokinase [Bacillus alkalicellulosilyticus]
MEKWLVGIDVGGTTIKMAFITTAGEIVSKWEIPTNTEDGGKYITKEIGQSLAEKVSELGESKEKLQGIGIGAPGFINMETGFIYHAVNIGWRDFPLKDSLEEETGLSVIVDNDANIAALGEMWLGAGDGANDLLCVTLGTGVGGGIVSNGNIVQGVNGMAGEIGHLTSVVEGGYQCNCGKTGCLETVASATGIARLATDGLSTYSDSSLHQVMEQDGKLTSKAVFDAYAAGDSLAKQAVETTCFHLGFAIGNLANAINPAKIVIGGGVSKAGNLLLEPLKKEFIKYALPRVAEGADFAIATLGNDAGVIGGAWLAKENSR